MGVPNVWQVAAADERTRGGQLQLKTGRMFIGPGEIGDLRSLGKEPGFWERLSEQYRAILGTPTKNQLSALHSFCRTAEIGDYVILLVGTKPLALGKIEGEYDYDTGLWVDGWDLQHFRKVEWKTWPEEESLSCRRQGYIFSTTSMLVPEKADTLWAKFRAGPVPQPFLPEIDHLQDENVRGKLVGLSNIVTQAYREQRDFIDASLEAHVIAVFVVPFLKKLGWKNSNIWVESPVRSTSGASKRADIIVGSTLAATSDGKCDRKGSEVKIVVEAKRLGAPLNDEAAKQAYAYAKDVGAETLAVTDGLRWSVFENEGGELPDEPTAWVYLRPVKQEMLPSGVTPLFPEEGTSLVGRDAGTLLSFLSP